MHVCVCRHIHVYVTEVKRSWWDTQKALEAARAERRLRLVRSLGKSLRVRMGESVVLATQ